MERDILTHLYTLVEDTWVTYAREHEPMFVGWMKTWVWRRVGGPPVAYLDPMLYKTFCEQEHHEVKREFELSDIVVTDAKHPESDHAIVIMLPNRFWSGYAAPAPPCKEPVPTVNEAVAEESTLVSSK